MVLNASIGGGKPDTKYGSIEEANAMIGIDSKVGVVAGADGIGIGGMKKKPELDSVARLCSKDTKFTTPEVDGSVGTVSLPLI